MALQLLTPPPSTSGGAWAALSDDLAALAERVGNAVVQVRDGGSGMGSGVVWDARGRVVTNYHVAPGRAAEVLLADDHAYPARVVAQAPGLDLTLLHVDALADHAAPLAVRDAATLRPGELLLAVGNPLGRRNAPALGVFNAHVRGPRGAAVQAAIALRPGNSGGALVDARGHLVGIPSMVAGYGVGLAVPSEVVQRFVASADAQREQPAPAPRLRVRWI